jgi:hypothetical protein
MFSNGSLAQRTRPETESAREGFAEAVALTARGHSGSSRAIAVRPASWRCRSVSLVAAPRVVDLVEAHRRRWRDSSVETAIFGPIDAGRVAGWYERVSVAALRSPIRRALFFAASAGCVGGVELGDGRQVVIKAYQPRWSFDLLTAVSSIQQRLAAAGFACPVPEVPPVHFEGVAASIDRLLFDPGMRLLDMNEMSVSAAGLAEAMSVLRPEHAQWWLDTHAMDRPSGSLYPIPHNPLFDFSVNAEEVAWIDELAAAALVAQDRDDTPPRMLHGDWSARNIRIVDNRLVASYDWDSVGAFPESRGMGIAAATWRSIGEANDPAAPDSNEIDTYLDAYIKSAGGSRSRQWRTAAMGSALYTLAYTARCEHSLEARDPRHPPRRARDTLDIDRDGFLAAIRAP